MTIPTIDLNDSEELLQQLWQTTNDAILVIDLQGIIQYVNPRVHELFGYDPDQLIGEKITKLNPQHQRDELDRAYQQFTQTGVMPEHWKDYKLVVKHRQGHELPVEINLNLIHVDDRQYVASFTRDVTSRKLAEQSHRHTEYRYQSVLNAVKEVIFEVDLQAVWKFLSPAWTKISGYTVGETLGTRFIEHIRPSYRKEHHKISDSLISREVDYLHYELEYLTKSKGSIWLDVFATAILDTKQNVIGIWGTLNDITQRKSAELKLNQSKER